MCVFYVFVADKMQSFQLQVTMKYLKVFEFHNDTPFYRFLRRNMMVAMKQYGDGLHHLEEMTTIHIKELLDDMEAKGNQAFDPKPMIKRTIGKLMMTLTYGSDCDEGLKRIAEVEENRNVDLFIETGPSMILNFCPALRYFVPSVKKTYGELLSQLNAYKNIFQDLTENRRKDFNEKNPEVYIDHFFNLLGKPTKVVPGNAHYQLLFSIHRSISDENAGALTHPPAMCPLCQYSCLNVINDVKISWQNGSAQSTQVTPSKSPKFTFFNVATLNFDL